MTTIKPLEWTDARTNKNEEWLATPIPYYLHYIIEKWKERYNIYINGDRRDDADDLNTAKHIAQADFESKIGKCLQ